MSRVCFILLAATACLGPMPLAYAEPPGANQGSPPGSTTLTARERRAAADWVKALFDLAPAGRGIAKVHFLNLGVDRSEIGRTRQHPMSKLLEEEVVAAPQSDSSFDFVHILNPPVEVCAVWISADGDDTKSSIQTIINQLDFDILSQ